MSTEKRVVTPIHEITIRRDAHTTTKVGVAKHEIAILCEIFSVENVHNAHGRRVDEAGVSESIGQRVIEDEYERLCSKYGSEIVEAVYGKKISGALDAAIEKAVEKGAAQPGKG